jgi:hypothetical protein
MVTPREFWRYSRVRLWWRNVWAAYDWKVSVLRCRIMAAICRYCANDVAPFLVGIGMEEIDDTMMRVRILEKAALYWDKERRKLVEAGWRSDVCMTSDEYDRWFGNG